MTTKGNAMKTISGTIRAAVLILVISIAVAPAALPRPALAAAATPGTWNATGSMSIARQYHTATLLPNGKVLVAGGHHGGVPLASAELYDPVSGTWTLTGSMNGPRSAHMAMLLTNGMVLVAGGTLDGWASIASAELYDPAAGTWSGTGSMSIARQYPMATLLPNGKVLVAGGYDGGAVASAQLYDPVSGTWSPTGDMGMPRYHHTLTLLPNGKVLAAGGNAALSSITAWAELYDPVSGAWSPTGGMNLPRWAHTALLLTNGMVLVAGGYGSGCIDGSWALAELYDPTAGTFSPTGSMSNPSCGSGAVRLANGMALFVPQSTNVLFPSELYDPVSGTFSPTGSTSIPRAGFTTTLLPDGTVLVAGGYSFPEYRASAELYTPSTSSATDTTPPTTTALVVPAPNAAGCSKSDMQVTLSATDDPGGSGVQQISYSATGAQPIAGTTVGGASAGIDLTNEGQTTLTFAAKDNVGNIETAQSRTIRLDKTAPAISDQQPAPGTAINSTTPAISAVVTDEGSGVYAASIVLKLDGAVVEHTFTPLQTRPDGIVTQAWVAFQIAQPLSDGQHTVELTASDLCGRQATIAPTPQVPPIAPIVSSGSLSFSAPGATGGNVCLEGAEAFCFDFTGEQVTVPGTLPDGTLPDGTYTITVTTIDEAGNTTTVSWTFTIDTTAPTVLCGAPDGLWHAGDVSITCTAGDGGAGLAPGADTSFSLVTNVVEGTETSDAATGSREICDVAGNCVMAGPVGGNKVDKRAPGITISMPTDTAYLLNQPVKAAYFCADGGSGMASCAGTVADSSPIDTASVGEKPFAVNASDQVGNSASQEAPYAVTYKIRPLYHKENVFKGGTMIPIKLQLADFNDLNMSSASIVVHATGVTPPANLDSKANPDNNFRFDPDIDGYVYILNSTGYAAGLYTLHFTVTGDPIVHTVEFSVK